MSGGVDSSVSAALLKEQGYDVVGVFIKAWEPAGFDCGWREDRRDAMRVASLLDIPFITLDLSKEYKEEVVDYMVAEYKAGRTPNPDVMCNKAIKFGAFYKRAMEAGADFVATGHYSRIGVIPAEAGILESVPRYELLAGTDKNKDQTYFLWTLKPDQLAHTLFPIGHLEKPEVRKLATKFGLPNQAKKDSQGLCFIGKLDVKDFLREFIKEQPGKVLDERGEVIGEHYGVLLYTLGERHGFNVFKKTPNDEPLYIVAKDLKANTITVADEGSSSLSAKNEVEISDVNWASGEPIPSKQYRARVRYRQPLENCQLKKIKTSDVYNQGNGNKFMVTFDNPQTASPGQSVVVYDGEVCLGGGVIV